MALISGESFWPNLPRFCSCTFSKDNVYDYPELKEMLPVDYNYTVCAWFQENEKYFECKFRTNVSTKNGALAWLEAFKRSSNTFYTVDKTFAEDTQNLVYKVIMKCYRNTRPRYKTQAHAQHTNCQARLTITVKRTKTRKSRSKDVHLNDFPMVIVYHHKHNHDSNPIKALQKHSINEVTDTFIKYFKEGLSPSQAIEQYTIHLKEKYGDEYHKALEDEGLFPPKHSVYQLYTKAFKKGYLNSNRQQMFLSLISHINKFNTEMKGRFSELKIFKDESFVVVIVSPLMQRVLLNIPETASVLFMDSFDNADNSRSKVFVFLTKSHYGVLPVGCVILSSCREDILSCALDQFKTFLNKNCFEGRGLFGPKIFMVEDNALVKSCISKAFPNASVILNIHLLLRSMWKYLMKANNIPLKRLQELLFKMKEMCYCDTEEELSLIYNKLKSSPLATEFPNYMSYVESLYARKEEWAKCFYHTLFSRDESLNDLPKQTIDVLEDGILQMKKVFGIENLFNYIVSDLDHFYRNKLLFIIDDQSQLNEAKKTLIGVNDYKESQVLEYGEKSFAVRSLKGRRYYFVELDIGVCNCRIGKNGANCEHQTFVSDKLIKKKIAPKSIDLEQKAILQYIATGKKDFLNSYLATLCDERNKESLEKASEVIILEQNGSAVLEFEEHLDIADEKFCLESVNENLGSKQEDKFKTLKQFQECVGLFAKQDEDTSVTLLTAKQFVNNFKKLKQNSVILRTNCFLNNNKTSECPSTAIVQPTNSNSTESIVHSDSSNKRRLIENNNQIENSITTIEPNKKLRTTKPLIVRISENMD